MPPVRRPPVVSKADFVAMAELAYRRKHTYGLANQMGQALGITEKTCQRWLDEDGPPAPLDVVVRTMTLADAEMEKRAEVLDRADALVRVACDQLTDQEKHALILDTDPDVRRNRTDQINNPRHPFDAFNETRMNVEAAANKKTDVQSSTLAKLPPISSPQSKLTFVPRKKTPGS